MIVAPAPVLPRPFSVTLFPRALLSAEPIRSFRVAPGRRLRATKRFPLTRTVTLERPGRPLRIVTTFSFFETRYVRARAVCARTRSDVSTGSQKLELPPTSVTVIVILEPAPRTISVAVRLTRDVVPRNQFTPGCRG